MEVNDHAVIEMALGSDVVHAAVRRHVGPRCLHGDHARGHRRARMLVGDVKVGIGQGPMHEIDAAANIARRTDRQLCIFDLVLDRAAASEQPQRQRENRHNQAMHVFTNRP